MPVLATLTNRAPLAAREIDPEALANLRHYGLSARAITGGIVAGQGEGVIVAILDSGIQAHSQFDHVISCLSI